MEIALLKLLLAHILGDFFLQPNSWVEEKEKKKAKSDKLYLHIAIHIALIFVVFVSFNVWKIALVIGVLHGIIDVLKLTFQTEKTKRIWFFVDQFLHVILIVGCWNYFYQPVISLNFLENTQFWLFLIGALFLTSPAAIFIRVIIAKWIPSKASSSLQDAGKFIGILERLLIYLFVCTHHFEAVGFLLAAKSIFRFGDLKEAHDIKLTEYVLIGTLLSFGIALIAAMTVMSIAL
jgi:magnesium-transporting ATPase (P-type)